MSEALVEAVRLSFAYEQSRGVHDLKFQIRPATLTALAGANGSGKSTLLRILAGIMKPQLGVVAFLSRPQTAWPPREYAREVGYLSQNPEMAFPITALDLVVSGRSQFLGRFQWESDFDFACAREALELCDAGHLAERLLHEMSGGERRRVFLARALAGRPKLLLLDEPLASLDSAHLEQISGLLRTIVQQRGTTIIYATHELNWAAAFSDEIMLLRDGRLIAKSSPEQVMNPDVLSEAFGYRAHLVEAAGRRWLLPRV